VLPQTLHVVGRVACAAGAGVLACVSSVGAAGAAATVRACAKLAFACAKIVPSRADRRVAFRFSRRALKAAEVAQVGDRHCEGDSCAGALHAAGSRQQAATSSPQAKTSCARRMRRSGSVSLQSIA